MRKQQRIHNVKKLLVFVLTFMLVMLEVNLQPIKVEAADVYQIPHNSSLVYAVGSQGKNQCMAYALSYCRTILDGYTHSGTEYWKNGVGGMFGSAGYEISGATSKQAMLKIVYNQINAGYPVCMYVTGAYRSGYNAGGDHWVAVIGYKTSANPDSLTESDFYIIDPGDCQYAYLTDGCTKYTTNALRICSQGSSYVSPYSEVYVDEISDTNAKINATLTSLQYLSNAGFYISKNFDMSSATRIDEATNMNVKYLWYDMNKWYGTLEKGTTYYYQFYIVRNGVETVSDIQYFTTTGDSTPPVISNVQVTDVTNNGYTVTCDVTDDVGVSKVCFPTWTVANGQDDLVGEWWINETVYTPSSGSTYSFRVNTSEHNNEGDGYITHVYAYDVAENESVYTGIWVTIDNVAPTISNIQVTDITREGYTVSCEVTDNTCVARVCFPTWTEANGMDDIYLNGDWYDSTAVYEPNSGNTYSFRVNISDHNNEGGGYITHVYAYDLAGNKGFGGGVTATINLDIPLQSITLSHTTLTLPITQSQQLSVASYTPSDTTVDKTVTWSSTNEAVAIVQADGTVVGKKAGRTTITAEVAGKTASCIVTVIPNDGSQVYEDFLYKVTGGTATITGYVGNAAQINIPQNINGYKVTTIGNGAFEGCTNLTGINIPDEITNIGAYAFTGCQNLKTIELPKGVTSIGEFAFLDCDNLTKLIYHGTEEQWKNIIGGNDISISKNAIQYVEVACPHTSTKNTTTKATISQDGKVVTKCTACNEITNTETIYKASTVKLSATSYTYNGKARKPTVTVKDSNGKKLKSGTDYTVSYASGRKNVGKYNVTIKFQGNYTGTKTLSFTVIPKKTSISKLTATKKGFEVKWKKQSSQTTGYQIQYSTKKNFQGSTTKNVTVNKNKTVTKSISKLSANKKYYVRIRTYKTVKVNGKSTKIYSDWSKVKTVTTKK